MKVLGKAVGVYLVLALLCYVGLFVYFSISLSAFMICTLAGALYWTFHEYVAHRFVLHPPHDKLREKEFYKFLHWKHHQDSENPGDIALPLPISLLIGVIVFLVFWAILGRLDYTLAMMPTIILGYLSYEWVHFYVHYNNPQSRVGKWYRKWHFIHHFKNDKRCYGVTSPIWDYVFRTN